MSRTRKGGDGGDTAEDSGTSVRRTQLTTLVKYNLRSMLQPMSLLLLLISALMSYYTIVLAMPSPSSPYFATGVIQSAVLRFSLYGSNEGLHPLFDMVDYYKWFMTLFMVVGGTIIFYLSVCGLVAEDSGSLPAPLLFSRPIPRGVFLVVGFAVRFPVAVALGDFLPFVVGYAQNVSAVGTAVEPYVTTHMTMDAWYSMAWDWFFWGYVALFVACLFALASIAVLVAAVSRRGVVTLPLAIGLSLVLSVVGSTSVASYVSYGSGIPFFLPLTPHYYFFGAIMSTTGMLGAYPMQNRLLNIDQGILILLVYGLVLLALAVFVYGRRDVG